MTPEETTFTWEPDILGSFSAFIQGEDGLPRAISQYGQPYVTVSFQRDSDGIGAYKELEYEFLQMLARCKQRGADKIVWRKRPTHTIDANGRECLTARLHCIPAVTFDEEIPA